MTNRIKGISIKLQQKRSLKLFYYAPFKETEYLFTINNVKQSLKNHENITKNKQNPYVQSSKCFYFQISPISTKLTLDNAFPITDVFQQHCQKPVNYKSKTISISYYNLLKMKTKTLLLLFFAISLVFTQDLIASDSKKSQCKTQDQCAFGYFCNEGKCLDKCALVRCKSGTICKEGQCYQKCDEKTPCQTGYYCNDSYCIDRCRFTKCGGDHYCQKGKCILIKKQCSIDSDCKKGFSCASDGSCVDSCILTLCPEGTTCSAGECKPIIKVCNKFCIKGYTCKQGQCVPIQPECPQRNLCSAPRPNQKTCPTLYFKRKPDPIVCGVSEQGEYIDFAVECYACKQKDIVYWFNTTCDKIPSKCKQQKKDCSLIKCMNGYVCEDGQCVKQTTWNQINCTLPRPNQKTCPTVNFIKEPEPLVCGVNKKGEYVDFPIECYACKQKDIVFYYNTTCEVVFQKQETLTCDDVSCSYGHQCSQGKCIKSKSTNKIKCNSPRPDEKSCPTLQFFRKPDPLVCGVSESGEHIDYPVECYACKDKSIGYYYNTTCDQISTYKCATVKCQNGQKCIDGKCFTRKFPVCEDQEQIQCDSPRPDQQACPLRYFFVKPDNIVCGITSTGQRISYPVKCYACKNDDVRYYYNKSCEQLLKPCPQEECKKDSDCKDSCNCQSGKCVDKCASTTCPKDYSCERGYCIPPFVDMKCKDVKCKSGEKCQKGKCVDKCQGIYCIATHKCVDGQCVPIKL